MYIANNRRYEKSEDALLFKINALIQLKIFYHSK